MCLFHQNFYDFYSIISPWAYPFPRMPTYINTQGYLKQTREVVPLPMLKRTEQKQSKMVGVGLEGLPTSLINAIMEKLDTQTLCSMACVSRALRSAVYEALSLYSSLDLSVSSLAMSFFKISPKGFCGSPLLFGPSPELLRFFNWCRDFPLMAGHWAALFVVVNASRFSPSTASAWMNTPSPCPLGHKQRN